MTLHLEDFSVGQKFAAASSYELTAERIKAFARDYDPQPFHLDEAAAAGSIFKGLAASGWHTAAITMRLITSMEPRIDGGVIGAGAQLDWPTAARPGDVLRIECTVLEVRPSRSKPDRGMILMQILTFNQHNEIRQDLKAKLLAYRRPG